MDRVGLVRLACAICLILYVALILVCAVCHCHPGNNSASV